MGADCMRGSAENLYAHTEPQLMRPPHQRSPKYQQSVSQRLPVRSSAFGYSRRMHAQPQPLSLKQVLFCGAMILTLSMGIRHGFGLWLQPITQEQGWSRQSFSL